MAATRLSLAALGLLMGCSAGGGHLAPGATLDELGFWALVDRAAQQGGAAVEDRGAMMTQLLKGAPPARLESWQQQLVTLDAQLNTRAVAAAFALACGGPLDLAGFAAARSWVVAHGRATYEEVTADADALAGVPELMSACGGSGEAFQDAALGRYSDLGFEPGGSAFPFVDQDPPTGPAPGALPRLADRFR